MGFRFRKSVKLMPGVRLNLGSRGASVSLGGRGATVNISKRGTRTTVGLPGTGLSYSTSVSGARRPLRQGGRLGARPLRAVGLLFVLCVFLVLLATVGGPGTVLLAAGVIFAALAVGRLRHRSTITHSAPSGMPASTAPVPSGRAVGSGVLAGAGDSPRAGAPASPLGPVDGDAPARAFAATAASLPARAAREVLPLLEERRSIESEPPSARRSSRIAEIDAELARLRADIATSPWRYQD